MDEQTRTEINRLYWTTDASVADIADHVGVSRRVLYDSIDPQPAEAQCPDCGEALAFRNRTAAERGEASCAGCGREVALGGDPLAGVAGANGPDIEQQARGAELSPMPARPVPGTSSSPVLGGALLAGIAAGAAVGYLLRRG